MMLQLIQEINWNVEEENLHRDGFAIVSNFLAESECEALKANYGSQYAFRKTVVMERYRFGLGEYKYFNYPLPEIIQQIRTSIYPKLVPIANAWFKALNINKHFPALHQALLEQCKENGQEKATVLMLKYGKGGFNTLHQDLYGEVYFPMQAVIFLSEPNKDFTGGEFVLTKQITRAQSKVIVLQPKKGDMLIFTTNFKPEKGLKGYYRVNMKHEVSELHSGERYTLGIIFHDAIT